MGQEIIIFIICTSITASLGVIAYFLKRTMERGDKNEKDISDINKSVSNLSDKFATKEEVREIKKGMQKLTGDIDFIKENTIRKDEFVRWMTRLENKIDNSRGH